MNRLPARSHGRSLGPSWPGRVLALLALAIQLAAASVVAMPAMAAAPVSVMGAPICHGPDVAPQDNGGSAPQHHQACDLCPLCQTIAQSGVVLLPGAISLMPPVRLASADGFLPPARAPPPRRPLAATSPRGPPAPV